MRFRARIAVAGVAAMALAIPVIAQQAPESLLPPGFGDPVPTQPAPPPQQQQGQPGTQTQPGQMVQQTAPSSIDFGLAADVGNAANAADEKTDEELAEERAKYDFPDSAKRLLTRIGPLTPETRGLAPNAFGTSSGRFLAALMRQSRAPFASRWGSILLRRTLLSATDTPGDINGADWTAERAWLLLRMGEADSARLLVQSVDVGNYTPRLYAVAMQTYLATADPAGLCPLSDGALKISQEPGWIMSRAICASLAGDQGTASGVLNQAERARTARGVDYRLTEKVVGAGSNSRRSVKIEWAGVDQLTAWRFGLATAVNVPIPENLYATVGPHVRAWEARAPVLSLPTRRAGVETAARLGVFSSAALVDYYSELAADPEEPQDFQDRAAALRDAYTAGTPADRLAAMRRLWTASGQDGVDFLGQIATARAAAALPVSTLGGNDIADLLASMLTAGYDRSAARWASSVARIGDDSAANAWALLAVGTPQPTVDLAPARVSAYLASAGQKKGGMLVAGLAGLGRLSQQEAGRIGGEAGLSLAPRTRWEKAIDAAAQRREQATVALLAGVGMQVADWKKVPAEHLYHIVSALRRVGLDPEARMIAAEAIARS